jgi:two-component system phosphate regulon response regulator PhoB
MFCERILIVEDEPLMRNFYGSLLRRAQRETKLEFTIVERVSEACEVLKSQTVDMIILDWLLPGRSGLDFLRVIRSQPKTKDIPVIMVTAKTGEDDCIEAFGAGADDFLRKPFNGEVLLARLRGLSRRRHRPWQDDSPLQCDGIRIDPRLGAITVDGQPVALRGMEIRLLEVLLRESGRLLPADYLWDRVWNYESPDWKHTLTNTVSRLRKGLGPIAGRRVRFAEGKGYGLLPGPESVKAQTQGL